MFHAVATQKANQYAIMFERGCLLSIRAKALTTATGSKATVDMIVDRLNLAIDPDLKFSELTEPQVELLRRAQEFLRFSIDANRWDEFIAAKDAGTNFWL